MNAAEKLNKAPGQVEGQAEARQKPKLEVVKQPESLEERIAALSRRVDGSRAKLSGLNEVLRSYGAEEISDPEERAAEAAQKADLEEEISGAASELSGTWEELQKLQLQKRSGELAHAWDDDVIGRKEYMFSTASGENDNDKAPDQALDAGNEASHEAMERTVEVEIPKEALEHKLEEKKGELERAHAEFLALQQQFVNQEGVLRRQLSQVDQEIQTVATQRYYFDRTGFSFQSPLLREIKGTNADLADRGQASHPIRALDFERSNIRNQLRQGEPKRSIFQKVSGFFNGQPSWKEQARQLESREKDISEAISEYENVHDGVKSKRDEFSLRFNNLEVLKGDIETRANPEYVKYEAAHNAMNETQLKINSLQQVMKELSEAIASRG